MSGYIFHNQTETTFAAQEWKGCSPYTLPAWQVTTHRQAIQRFKKKGELVPVHATKACIASFIRNLGAKQR
jgi:hypothetical protein